MGLSSAAAEAMLITVVLALLVCIAGANSGPLAEIVWDKFESLDEAWQREESPSLSTALASKSTASPKSGRIPGATESPANAAFQVGKPLHVTAGSGSGTGSAGKGR